MVESSVETETVMNEMEPKSQSIEDLNKITEKGIKLDDSANK